MSAAGRDGKLVTISWRGSRRLETEHRQFTVARNIYLALNRGWLDEGPSIVVVPRPAGCVEKLIRHVRGVERLQVQRIAARNRPDHTGSDGLLVRGNIGCNPSLSRKRVR